MVIWTLVTTWPLLGQAKVNPPGLRNLVQVPAEVVIRPNPEKGFIAFSGVRNRILIQNRDAATVIQTAVDSLPEQGGKIYLGAGTYPLTRSLRIKDKHGVHLEGASRGMQASDQGGTVIWAEDDINLLEVDARSFRLFGITLSNLLFFGSGKDNGKTGILVEGTVDVLTLYNVGVNNCGIGIHLSGAPGGKRSQVLDAPQIYFCDPQRNGIGLFIERCHYGKIVGGEYSDNLEYGIKIAAPETRPHESIQAVKIMTVTAVRNGLAGILVGGSANDISIGGGSDIGGTLWGSGILISDEGSGIAPENIIINGIHSYNNSESGVEVEAGRHVIIQGSIFSNHTHRSVTHDPPQRYGIKVSSAVQDILVDGNITYGNAIKDLSRD